MSLFCHTIFQYSVFRVSRSVYLFVQRFWCTLALTLTDRIKYIHRLGFSAALHKFNDHGWKSIYTCLWLLVGNDKNQKITESSRCTHGVSGSYFLYNYLQYGSQPGITIHKNPRPVANYIKLYIMYLRNCELIVVDKLFLLVRPMKLFLPAIGFLE